MSAFQLLFSFRGTMTRAQFWIALAASIPLGFPLWPVRFLILAAAAAKRCRARGVSPWWAVLTLVPILGLAWAMVSLGALEDDPSEGRSADFRQDVGVAGRVLSAGAAASIGLWILVIGPGLTVMVLDRNLWRGTLFAGAEGALHQWSAWLLVAAAAAGGAFGLLACLAGSAGEVRSLWRTPLSVWPGIPLALTGIAILLAVGSQFVAIQPLLAVMARSVEGYSLIALILPLAATTAVLGPRQMSAGIVLAAPATLVTFVAILLEQSIYQAFMYASAPMLAIAAAFAVAGVVTRAWSAVWWAVGALLVPIGASVLGTGLMTPSELAAMTAAVLTLAFVFEGLVVRSGGSVEGLTIAAVEASGLLLAVVVAGVWALLLDLSGAKDVSVALGANVAPIALMLILGGLLVGFAWLLTPALALAILVPAVAPLLGKAEIGLSQGVTVLGIAALVGFLLRTLLLGADRPTASPFAVPKSAMVSAIAVALLCVVGVPWLHPMLERSFRGLFFF